MKGIKTISAALSCLFLLGCTATGSSEVKPIGQSNLCIPQDQLLQLSLKESDGEHDISPQVYEAMSISWEEMQEAVPEYKDTKTTAKGSLYNPLHITITQAKERELPPYPQHVFLLDPEIPLLTGVKPEKIIAWDVLEGHRSNYKYWGDCTFDAFEQKGSVSCNRRLNVYDLNFDYSISQENLKLYTQIDRYLLDKLKGWECSLVK